MQLIASNKPSVLAFLSYYRLSYCIKLIQYRQINISGQYTVASLLQKLNDTVCKIHNFYLNIQLRKSILFPLLSEK